jgi:hypothetical protein
MRLKSLIEKRERKFIPLWVCLALFFFLVGLMGFPYGAALFYWPLAAIFLAQVFHPTLLVWGLAFGLCLAGGVMYVQYLIVELVGVYRKKRVFISADADDLIVVLFFVVVLISFAGLLYFAKPKKLTKKLR